MREYVKHSLYDRVSTRPFLTSLEKKWITFQVLCALHQCHKQKICHGDIKASASTPMTSRCRSVGSVLLVYSRISAGKYFDHIVELDFAVGFRVIQADLFARGQSG